MLPTYCNPLSMPSCPRGTDRPMTCEPYIPYRSISDPSALYYNGKFYLYPSYGMAWVSDNLETWEYVPCEPYAKGPAYSPTVIPHRGRFYLTIHSDGLYVGDTPVGPFKAVGDFIMPDGTRLRPVDPALFEDTDGKPYLYWHSGTGNGIDMTDSWTYGAALDPDDPQRVLTEPVIVNRLNTAHTWERFGQYNQDSRYGWIEGQHMLKYNGRYYLIYSGSGTQFSSYANGVYVSDNPLTGFRYQTRNPLTAHREGLIKGAGHGCVIEGPNGTLWAFYTTCVCAAHQFERRIGIDPVGVDENGELYCTVTDTPQYAAGVLKNPARGNTTGALPLTFFLRGNQYATSQIYGRESFYALDENLSTWWEPKPEDKTPALTVDLRADYVVEGIRIAWRDVGLDYDAGILPGPFGYRVDITTDHTTESGWTTLLDCTDNTVDLNIDYRATVPTRARAVRLTVTSHPRGITPGVVSFTAFGRRT